MAFMKLNDICLQICDGVHNTVIDTPNEPYYLLSAKNIKNGKVNFFDDDRTISLETMQSLNKRTKLAKDDVVLTTVGSIGEVAVISDDNINYEFQRSVGIFKPNKDIIYPKYLYYCLKSKSVNTYLKNNTTGAAQPCLFIGFLKKIKIDVCDYKKQIEISEKLSKYDDLIEINTKKIKILEEMAEKLYKEWFVHFRFPGYENVGFKKIKLVGWAYGDNKKEFLIPSNWEYDELTKVGLFKRGKNITSNEMIDGDIKVISAGLEPSGKHNEYNVEGYNLTVSASGANAGYLSYHLENIWAADCSYYNNNENIWFVYNSLKFLEPVIRNMQIGSAQPHVYAKNLNRITLIIPSNDLIKKYESIVEPIYEEIKKINNKNKNLEKQRDLLLPRLMSGKLSV